MSKLETLLVDELKLQQQLKALSESLGKQLQETERRTRDELERRVLQNALLSTDVDGGAGDNKDLDHKAKYVGLRKSTSASALTSDHLRQSDRLNLSSPEWISSTNLKRCSMLAPTQMIKDKEAEAECQKQFCAVPVPDSVVQPLYKDMMELREKHRKQGHKQRREFLLSIQKPFSFQEREKEKREKLIAMLTQVSHHDKNKATTVRKPFQDSTGSVSKDQEVCGKVPTQMTDKSSRGQESPAASGGPKLRPSERARRQKLGFLDDRPSFRPKIIQQVPDFSRLHRALQTEGLRNAPSKAEVKCQPFNLRTAALPDRQRRTSPENSQAPKISNLGRSRSLGALTSLSTDTLPTYITDAARKRCMAIRKSMDLRDSKNQESAGWLKEYQMKSRAMSKTVALHAKLLDPHSSLKEVCEEKVQRHREADLQRMREYMRELRDMKARVSERPFLFQQVKQKNAKTHAEQTYRDKLKKAGLIEQFVEENGDAVGETSPSSSPRSEDDTDHSDIHSREENVADGEKIEDVEEKSVKSRVEEIRDQKGSGGTEFLVASPARKQ